MTRPTRHAWWRRGFTLIEMMASAAVMLFMLAAISQLAIQESFTSTAAIMNTEAARYAQSLLQEQVAQGYYVALSYVPTTSSPPVTVSSIYSPTQGVQGYKIYATLQFVNTSGTATAGSWNIGVASVLVIATTQWILPNSTLSSTAQNFQSLNLNTTTIGAANTSQWQTYVQQLYIVPPPSTPVYSNGDD